jgi:hypothetical protein
MEGASLETCCHSVSTPYSTHGNMRLNSRMNFAGHREHPPLGFKMRFIGISSTPKHSHPQWPTGYSCTSHGRCSKTQRRHLNRSPLTYGPQTGCHTPQSDVSFRTAHIYLNLSFCVEKTIHFWGPFCAIGVEPCWTFLIPPTLLMVC